MDEKRKTISQFTSTDMLKNNDIFLIQRDNKYLTVKGKEFIKNKNLGYTIRSVSTIDSPVQANIGELIKVNASKGIVTIFLPDSTEFKGKSLIITKNDESSHVVKIDGRINGNYQEELLSKYDSINLISCDDEWLIL